MSVMMYTYAHQGLSFIAYQAGSSTTYKQITP